MASCSSTSFTLRRLTWGRAGGVSEDRTTSHTAGRRLIARQLGGEGGDRGSAASTVHGWHNGRSSTRLTQPPVATVRDDALSGDGDDDTSQAAAAYIYPLGCCSCPTHSLVCLTVALKPWLGRTLGPSQAASQLPATPSLHLPAVLRSRPARTPHPCLLATVYTSNHRSCLVAIVSCTQPQPAAPTGLPPAVADRHCCREKPPPLR